MESERAVVGAAANPGGPGAAVWRALHEELDRARARLGGLAPRVLDVGGGTGVWAVPLAVAGCAVTVVDTSPNALAALAGRAREAGVADRISARQGDALALTDVVAPAEADLVLGHGLLEMVDDLTLATRQLAEAAAPGGAVSALVAGRHAAVLTEAQAGRLAEARSVLVDAAGRWGTADPVQRRLDAVGLRRLLEGAAGLSVELLQGDGVFDGWVPAAVLDASPDAAEHLNELELLAAGQAALLVIAARLHAMARRPAPD